METKAKNLLGLKVITLNNGKEIEKVDDVVYDPRSNKLVALVVDAGGWFSDAKILLFEDIKTLGPDAIIIENENVIKKASQVPSNVSHITNNETYLTQTNIITEDGKELGKVSDLYFDSLTGAVTQLEVSQGLKNLQSGKKRVNVSDIITIGENATIVKAYTEDVINQQAQEQGIQGAINTAKDKSPGILDQAQSTLQNVATKANEKIGEINQTVKDKTVQAKDDYQEHKLMDNLGKYVNKNILAPDGNIIAKRGDIITPGMISQAEQYDLTGQLISNSQKEPLPENFAGNYA